jgi:hypothetical protein
VRNLLESWIGKEIDAMFEGATLTGKIVRVEGNLLVLELEKDEQRCYVNIEKIVAVSDRQEKKLKSAGFVKK